MKLADQVKYQLCILTKILGGATAPPPQSTGGKIWGGGGPGPPAPTTDRLWCQMENERIKLNNPDSQELDNDKSQRVA